MAITLRTPEHIRTAGYRRQALWLIGSGLYGAITSAALIALLVIRG